MLLIFIRKKFCRQLRSVRNSFRTFEFEIKNLQTNCYLLLNRLVSQKAANYLTEIVKYDHYSLSTQQSYSSIMQSFKEKENIEARFHKNASPFEIITTMNKTANSRDRVLKQLEQLGVDLAQYEHIPLQALIAKTETLMRNTYSVKYLGLNKNQMGIISRRINPFTDKHFKIHEALGETYSVHKYFYPKPLKTGKKQHVVQTINVNNLQNQIKKEFQQKEAQKQKHFRQHRDDKLKTKMAGSWCSLNKNIVSPPKKTPLNPNQLANEIMPKIVSPQSFSRFLNKGILIVRD